MGIEVLDFHLSLLLKADKLRQRFGLMTNDSIIAATAVSARITTLATSDRDFDRITELEVVSPSDLHGL